MHPGLGNQKNRPHQGAHRNWRIRSQLHGLSPRRGCRTTGRASRRACVISASAHSTGHSARLCGPGAATGSLLGNHRRHRLRHIRDTAMRWRRRTSSTPLRVQSWRRPGNQGHRLHSRRPRCSHQRGNLIAAMTDPRIRIVSLTSPRKGYCHDPATGSWTRVIPMSCTISSSHGTGHRARPHRPMHAMCARLNGIAPLHVLCAATISRRTARPTQRDRHRLRPAPRQGAWPTTIAGDVAFPFRPWSIRIVPATTEADRKLVVEATGVAMPGRS
jgi:hypothetical protein